MQRWRYNLGLHDLGNGCYARLQPEGTWGYSNAGLIVDGSETLLVDTLFDLRLTRDMLEGMRRSIPAAARIGMLFNTHGNGDHTFGNQLVKNARVIATRSCLLGLAYVPQDRTVFSGDLLFVGGHPVVWAGPIANCIAVCDRMLSWDVETIVPGHGPITDKSGLAHSGIISSFCRRRPVSGTTPVRMSKTPLAISAGARSVTGPIRNGWSSMSTPRIGSSAAIRRPATWCGCSH